MGQGSATEVKSTRIRLSRPVIGREELKAVKGVLNSGWLAYHSGGNVDEFEEKIKEYLKVDHAVAVSSCTAALHLALLSLPEKPRAVIIPDFTFPATGNVVELAGARPILVDVSFIDYNIDPNKAERVLSISNHSAAIPVHLFGCPCDMDSLCELSEKYGAPIIEDAACSLGAKFHNRFVGTFGVVGTFSLHATKGITTGEGGILVTNDEEVADLARMLRNHGRNSDGKFLLHGFNYRMTEIQAAIGIVQLKKIDRLIAERRKLAEYYTSKLRGIEGVRVPVERKWRVWQRYVVALSDGINRDEIIDKLKKAGVETAHGTFCLSDEPAFEPYARANPMARFLGRQTLSLPLYPGLKREEQDYVIEKLVGEHKG